MFRAAAATIACRCRYRPTLVSQRGLTTCPLIVSNLRFLSSAARNQPDDHHDPVITAAPPVRDAYWNKMYHKLECYVMQHGHARVLSHYSSSPSLGRWVEAQRRQYRLLQHGKKSTLSHERIDLLNQVGMIWDVRDHSWEERYEELLIFYYQHGHVNVPLRHSGGLGNFVYKQRSDFKARQRGEATQLTTDRMIQLSALGMVWDIPQQSWDDSYRQLVEYHEKHGHTNVPINVADPFSVWVHSQRREYKKFVAGEYSRITQERIDRLNDLNFVWDLQETIWLSKYQELCRYRQEHGNCIVPKTHVSLGRWVGQQREQYKKYKDGDSGLSLERIEMLEKTDFVWNAQDALWRERLEELREHVNVNGQGCAPPRKTHNTLARWLNRQLDAYEKMQNGEKVAMNEERAMELRKLGFLPIE